MHKILRYVGLAIGACLFLLIQSCASNGGYQTEQPQCLSSAGYVYSHLKKQCIRVFEQGINVQTRYDGNAQFATYAVFSDDGMRVEIFFYNENAEILDKQGSCWENTHYQLSYVSHDWQLKKRQ